jgi:hypothetical protein
MATNTAIEKKPQTLEERLVEASIKEQEKQVKEQTAQRLQSGQSPEEILSALMQSIGQKPSSENLIGELSELAKTPVGTGKKMAIMPSLLSGQGFSRPEKTEPLGMGKAIQVMGLQQQIEKAPGEQMKTGLDIVQKLMDLQKETPEGFQKELEREITKTRTIERVKQEEKLLAERKEAAVNIQTNFNTAISQFKGLIAQAKGAGEEQDGLGLAQGLYGSINAIFKNPNFSRRMALPGQIKETSLVLNRILTGQNRVIQGVVKMIGETLLTPYDPPEAIAAKTAQSVTNAYRITSAFNKVGLTPDVLDKMSQQQLDALDVSSLVNSIRFTPEEEAELEAMVQDVLATPAMKARQLPGFEKGKTKPTKTVEGKAREKTQQTIKKIGRFQVEVE